MRINVGCGQGVLAGWVNYDNSPAVLLGRSPLFVWLARTFGLVDAGSLEFAEYCRKNHVQYANAQVRLPHADASVDIIYSSHMIEHLDRREARRFLQECLRVLRPGGVLRLVVPDLRVTIDEYLQLNHADIFLAQLQFDLEKPRGLKGHLSRLIFGGRGHHWMYDRQSLQRLVEASGFVRVSVLKGGETRIADPGALDLHEREIESIFLEADRP